MIPEPFSQKTPWVNYNVSFRENAMKSMLLYLIGKPQTVSFFHVILQFASPLHLAKEHGIVFLRY